MLKIPEHGVIKTPKCSNWIEDGILFSLPDDHVYLDLEEAKAITKAFQQLSDTALPLFVDLHTITGQSAETRNYFANDPVHTTTFSAVALYVSNLLKQEIILLMIPSTRLPFLLLPFMSAIC